MLTKLNKKIKNIEDFNLFISKLIIQVKNNKSISNNPMIDGLIIGFLIYKQDIVFDMLFLNKNVGQLLDGTIQQIEQIKMWFINNENYLFNIN